MKVFNLRCARQHGFEGWFGSEDDYASQVASGLVGCPLCGDTGVRRVPSAPRLNLSGAAGSAAADAPGNDAAATTDERQAHWLRAVRELVARTEDVGERFAEEARRIHYGEVAGRGIRGRTSREEAEALAEEGIEVMPLPLPPSLKEPLQ
jgi:hypothetical protein